MDRKRKFALVWLFLLLSAVFADSGKGSGEQSEEREDQRQSVDLELNVPNENFRKSIVVNLNDDEVFSITPLKDKLKKKKLKKII